MAQNTSSRFLIDGKIIRNATGKRITIAQYDHNSMVFDFQMPRIIEGGDITGCDVVEVHYDNIDPRTRAVRKGVGEVKDLRVSEEDDTQAVFSWRITRNATKIAGPLEFRISFKRIRDGETEFEWSTDIHKRVIVTRGIANGEAVVEEYADILEQWRQELFDSDNGHCDGCVKTVNGIAPDAQGNVEVPAGKGEKGDPGITPHIGENGNWYIGDTDTGVAADGSNSATVTAVSVTESADGTVTMVNTLSNGETETMVITPDGDGNPSMLTYNGTEIPITWNEVTA